MISELLQAIALAMVIEGLYYALMPDKAQEAMRRLCSVPASVLRNDFGAVRDCLRYFAEEIV